MGYDVTNVRYGTTGVLSLFSASCIYGIKNPNNSVSKSFFLLIIGGISGLGAYCAAKVGTGKQSHPIKGPVDYLQRVAHHTTQKTISLGLKGILEIEKDYKLAQDSLKDKD